MRKWVISHEGSKVDVPWVPMATLASEERVYFSVILQLWGGLERTLGNK